MPILPRQVGQGGRSRRPGLLQGRVGGQFPHLGTRRGRHTTAGQPLPVMQPGIVAYRPVYAFRPIGRRVRG